MEVIDMSDDQACLDRISASYTAAADHAAAQRQLSAHAILGFVGEDILRNNHRSWREAKGLIDSICMDYSDAPYLELSRTITEYVAILNLKTKLAEAELWSP